MIRLVAVAGTAKVRPSRTESYADIVQLDRLLNVDHDLQVLDNVASLWGSSDKVHRALDLSVAYRANVVGVVAGRLEERVAGDVSVSRPVVNVPTRSATTWGARYQFPAKAR